MKQIAAEGKQTEVIKALVMALETRMEKCPGQVVSFKITPEAASTILEVLKNLQEGTK